MRVFDPIPLATTFQFVHPIAPDDWETIEQRFDAHVAGDEWIPRPLELIVEDEGRKLERGDWLYFSSHIPVLRPAAALAIKHVLDPGDLLLPMTCGKDQLYFVKPKWTIDALDEPASTIWRAPDGAMTQIRKHVFKAEAIGKLTAFYITRIRSSDFYVTDRFVQAWENAGLRGVRFNLLWESPSSGQM